MLIRFILWMERIFSGLWRISDWWQILRVFEGELVLLALLLLRVEEAI